MRDASGRRPLSRRDLVLGGATAAAAIGGSLLSGTDAIAAPRGADPAARTRSEPVSGRPAASPPTGGDLGGLDDWLGSVVQVANVAANMLPLFLLAQAGGPMPPPFQTGGVQFEYLTIDGQTDLYAHNVAGEDAGLSYSLTRSEPATNVSVYQPLPTGGAYQCQSDLSEFVNGQVYLAPTPVTTAADGTVSRAVSFAVRGLAIAASVNVIGGIKVSVDKDPNTGTFTASITTTGTAKALRAQVAATGPDGDVVRAQWEASSARQPADNVIKIALPVGVNLDPVVQSLELLLDLDSAGFDQLTAERRSRVIML